MHPASRRDVFFIYFAIMIQRFLSVLTMHIFLCLNIEAQTVTPSYAPYTTKEARTKEYKYLISNSINKNLLLDLTDSTEENWQNY